MNHPEIFYKYTSAETAKLVLRSSKLRWSNPSEFNDLFEFQRMPIFKPTIEEAFPDFIKLLINNVFNGDEIDISRVSKPTQLTLKCIFLAKQSGKSKKELLKTLMIDPPFGQDKVTSELKAHTEEWSKFSRVLCITTEFDNDIMWANYAVNNTGCVMGFRHLPKAGTALLEAKQVKYTDGLPIICTGLDFLLYGDTSDLRKKSVEAVYYTKKMGWSYEKEWRCITRRSNEKDKSYNDYKFYPDELESVTFGAKISNENIIKISTIVNEIYEECDIYQIFTNNGELTRKLIKG